MNHISLKQTTKPIAGPTTVEATFSPYCEDVVVPVLRQEYEIEMLQGERTVLPDGDVKYVFVLSEDKAVLFRDALKMTYAKVTGHYTDN